MKSIELMSRLRSHNVRVWAENGQLRYSAPKGVMTDDLLADIRTHKQGLLELLGSTGRFRRAAALSRVARTDTLPLSFAQERLWFLEHLFPESGAYNSGLMMRLAGNLDIPALQKSLQALVDRHESLRTCFPTIDDKPVQVVLDDCPVSIAEHDLRALPEEEREAAADKLIEGEIRRPFDLVYGPVTRARLLRMADQEHILLIMIHHIATDGWSRGIIQRELTALYNAQVLRQTPSLPSLPVQYADFAHWQRQWLSGEVLEHQLQYWRTQLADFPTLDLPTDRRRPPVQSQSGADDTFWLSKSLTRDLKALSRQAEVTLATTLLAAFQVLLARYTGQTDIAVGSPIANRPRLELENLVGLFVNSLVMRADLSGDPTFREVLARVNEVALGAYEHQDVPFEQLVAELQPDRDFSRNPLFQVMFAFQNAPREVPAFQGLTIRPVGNEITTTRMDLECFVWEGKEGLHVNLVFNTGLFDRATIERLGTYFRKVLAEVVSDPARRLSQISLLNEAERKQLLSEWNDTETTYPREDRIHDLFEAQVERTPDATALVFGEETLTYRELDTRANHIAHYLKHQHGVGAEVCVGLCMERSPEMVAGILGILKAGGAYVPLDPAYPPARLAYILEDARTRLLLTQERLVQGLPQSKADVVCVDTDPDCARSAMATTPHSQATSKNLAYLIYTSGSTGQPKGVAIEHRSAVALLHWANGVFGPDELRGVLASTSVCFDLSVFEMFVPLNWGGTVILAENILGLPELARAEEVTLVNTVPSGLTALLRGNPLPASVRTVNLAGEPLRPQLVREIHNAGNVEKIYDLYGPSEDTTYSTKALREWDDPEVIGRPIANTQVYLLDQYLQPVPIGATGELYLGGEGLARGYFDRPALTSEKFIPDPFARKPGARLYRTGDLARYLTDGRIQYLGRADHQVKIRGYRIELGEIEVTLSQHPSVRQAVVVVREDEPGEKQVVAYVVLVEETLSPNELRRHLKQTLPEYMVPAHFVMLDALPVTPNGKVDRRALPAPEGRRPELDAAYQAPRGPVEETLARIWTEVLRTDQVGRDDNFFDLGGHSLLATQMVSRIQRELKVDLRLIDVFRMPTIAELTKGTEGLLWIDTHVSSEDEAESQDREELTI